MKLWGWGWGEAGEWEGGRILMVFAAQPDNLLFTRVRDSVLRQKLC